MKILSTFLWLTILLSSTISHAAPVTRFIHSDALGSPVAATDINGKVIWREEYKPFGERIIKDPKAEDQKRWYTGHVQDRDTGLVYMGARFYDPVIGRFLTPDPVGFSSNYPSLFNRYAYANNNPYKYVDPDGRLFTAFHKNRKGLSSEQAVMVGAMGNTATEVGAYSADGITTATGVGGIVKQGVKYGVKGLTKVLAKNADDVASNGSAIANASRAAFQAVDDIASWIPKDKHLLSSTAKRARKFNTDSLDEVRSIVSDALRSPDAKFMKNPDGGFRVVTELGRQIGSKGETSIRIAIGDNGKIWTAFPVR